MISLEFTFDMFYELHYKEIELKKKIELISVILNYFNERGI